MMHPTAAILSVYFNKLVTDFDSARAVVDQVCGQHVWLWDYARARKHAATELGKQHPWLLYPDTDPGPDFRNDSPGSTKFVRRIVKLHGEQHYVARIGRFRGRTGTQAYEDMLKK